MTDIDLTKIPKQEIMKNRPWDTWTRSDFFQVWPLEPNIVAKYGKYFIRWRIEEKPGPQPGTYEYSYQQKFGAPKYDFDTKKEISIDGKTWVEMISHMQYGHPPNKNEVVPDWFNYKDFESEIYAAKKMFMKKRAKEQAKVRKAKFLERAKSLGEDPKKLYEKEKQIRIKELNRNKLNKKAKKMVVDLERRMKLSSELKNLKDEISILENKVDDQQCNLALLYFNTQMPYLEKCISVLKELGYVRPAKGKGRK